MAVIERMIFLLCHCYQHLQQEQENRYVAANMKARVCADMYADDLIGSCCHASWRILLWSGVYGLSQKKSEDHVAIAGNGQLAQSLLK